MVPNSVHLAGVVEQTNLLRDRRVVGGCAKSMMRMASLPCHNPATLSWDFRHCQMTIISCNFHALEAHLFLHCTYQSTSTSGKKTLVAINSVSGNPSGITLANSPRKRQVRERDAARDTMGVGECASCQGTPHVAEGAEMRWDVMQCRLR